MKTGFAIYKYPFGLLKIGYEDTALVLLKKMETATDFGQATDFTDRIYAQIIEYLNGKRKMFSLEYKMYGTEFQKKVWEQLLKIPYGETRTYKEIAIAIGNPKACRAVGMANNKNPISIVVPCHRVIGSNGDLVGYAGGLDIKKALLDLERQNKYLSSHSHEIN